MEFIETMLKSENSYSFIRYILDYILHNEIDLGNINNLSKQIIKLVLHSYYIGDSVESICKSYKVEESDINEIISRFKSLKWGS